ncbi:MAG TPA: hypothetical protein VFE65_04715 [Pseudonocardia sp.]|nr:hypothetical protein [Pseudonocardia sp.]
MNPGRGIHAAPHGFAVPQESSEPPEPSVDDAGTTGPRAGVAAAAAGGYSTVNISPAAAVPATIHAGHRVGALDTAGAVGTTLAARPARIDVGDTVIVNHSGVGKFGNEGTAAPGTDITEELLDTAPIERKRGAEIGPDGPCHPKQRAGQA